MADGNGSNRWLIAVSSTLFAAFVFGGVGLLSAQSSTNERITAVEKEQDRIRPTVNSVDVIQRDIENIKGDIRDILEIIRKQ